MLALTRRYVKRLNGEDLKLLKAAMPMKRQREGLW
jgi:hypothetical protein